MSQTGREVAFIRSKSRHSPWFATERQLTDVLLTDSVSQSNGRKGRLCKAFHKAEQPPDDRWQRRSALDAVIGSLPELMTANGLESRQSDAIAGRDQCVYVWCLSAMLIPA
jgi:hypothetical protein